MNAAAFPNVFDIQTTGADFLSDPPTQVKDIVQDIPVKYETEGIPKNTTAPKADVKLRTIVRYSPFNIDSKLAAVIMLQHLSADPSIDLLAVPYDHQSHITEVGDTEIVIGVDMLEEDARLLLETGVMQQRLGQKEPALKMADHVQVYSIQVPAVYEKIVSKRNWKGAAVHTHASPRDPEVLKDEELGHRTQCVSWVVANWCFEQGSPRTGLWDYVALVSKYVNLKMVDNYDIKKEKELRVPINMARLVSLNRRLDDMLSKREYTLSPSVVLVTADAASQIARTRVLRQTLGKNVRQETYTLRSKAAVIPTMTVTESDAMEMLYQALFTMRSFVSYEDVRTHRIWRVYAKDPKTQQFLADTFKEKAKATWREGLITYIATDLPVVK